MELRELLIDLFEHRHPTRMFGDLGVQLAKPALLLLALLNERQTIGTGADHGSNGECAAEERDQGDGIFSNLSCLVAGDHVERHDCDRSRGEGRVPTGERSCEHDRQHEEELELVVVMPQRIDDHADDQRQRHADQHSSHRGDAIASNAQSVENPAQDHHNATTINPMGPISR